MQRLYVTFDADRASSNASFDLLEMKPSEVEGAQDNAAGIISDAFSGASVGLSVAATTLGPIGGVLAGAGIFANSLLGSEDETQPVVPLLKQLYKGAAPDSEQGVGLYTVESVEQGQAVMRSLKQITLNFQDKTGGSFSGSDADRFNRNYAFETSPPGPGDGKRLMAIVDVVEPDPVGAAQAAVESAIGLDLGAIAESGPFKFLAGAAGIVALILTVR